jgi:cbb3-type cytochrome oxidase subunit 3
LETVLTAFFTAFFVAFLVAIVNTLYRKYQKCPVLNY